LGGILYPEEGGDIGEEVCEITSKSMTSQVRECDIFEEMDKEEGKGRGCVLYRKVKSKGDRISSEEVQFPMVRAVQNRS